MSILQLTTYFAAVFFIIAVLIKIVYIARTPLHLRWELYPIPHEKGKSSYGGSYYEETDWWTKPQAYSRPVEIREIALEILFLKTVFKYNRPLWCFSLPFHLGLYLLVSLAALLIGGAFLQIMGYPVTSQGTGLARIIYSATLMCGYGGWILTLGAALGLLAFRTFRSDVRRFSIPADYINLLFLAAICGAGLIVHLTTDSGYVILRGFIQHLLTFSEPEPLPRIASVLCWLTAAMLIYFPFTHMTHFVGKFFTFHKIRWEDRPLQYDPKMESRIDKALLGKVGWYAPHIHSGSTWGESASETGTTDEKK